MSHPNPKSELDIAQQIDVIEFETLGVQPWPQQYCEKQSSLPSDARHHRKLFSTLNGDRHHRRTIFSIQQHLMLQGENIRREHYSARSIDGQAERIGISQT